MLAAGLLVSDLCRVFDWSREWKLKFNIPMCVFLWFTSGNTLPSHPGLLTTLIIKIYERQYVTETRVFIFSGDLSWSPHYDLICSRDYRMLDRLQRVFKNAICILVKKNLCTSLVCSQFSYCSIILRAQLIKDIKFLENVL